MNILIFFATKERRILLAFVGLLLLALGPASCARSTNTLGPRPALELSSVVEAYLQLYQPGSLPRLFQTTYVYDRNGELLAELYSEGRRTWVALDRISPHLIDAVIATEDATFFTNTGIDPVRIAGAALRNVEEGQIVSGASTITMQLARNLFLGSDERYDQNFDRKILEAGLARELTETYSKNELLEMYLNLLNYGHLAYGPEAAARVYFGKPAADLTLAEATLLAGIPQQPARLDLFTNFEAAKQRQKVVLALMVRHGYLSEVEANAVFSEPVVLNPNPDTPTTRTPHFTNYVIDTLEAQLGREFVRRAGLHIYTTLDLRLQDVAQEVVAHKVAELQPRYDMDNGALVALKPGTAEILAMVGSIDFTNAAIDGQVNVATSLRQPGSSIKPVLYATALSDNLISPATVLWDTSVTYTVGLNDDYRPLNYDRKFHGPVTARAALANSFNVPAVKLLDAVGVARMLESAQAMGIHSLNRGAAWYGLSLTLGGGEVTLLDLATAYHTIANRGRYLPPRSVLAISDSQGQSLLDDVVEATGVQVITPAAAALVTDILSDNPARTPMFGARSALVLDRPVAAKTGTTDDNRDAWTMGYTRYLLTGVWVGNTDGRPMRNATGAGAAAPIWNEFMRTVLDNPDLLAVLDAPDDAAAWEFPLTDDVELRNECPPGLRCRHDGGELFSVAWLDAAGQAGPLADSVVRAASAPVYVDQGEGGRLAGYCGYDQGAVRSLLRLPHPFGLPNPGDNQLASLESDANPGLFSEETQTPDLERERRAALEWSLRANTRVYLGLCERMEALAQATGLAIGIDLVNAGQEEVAETSDTANPVAASSPAVTGDSRYILQDLYHDDQCPGSYIMGIVTNWEGVAVPGVRLRLDDAWGNHYQAVSKNGAADFGRFDFPLYSQTPQNLTLTVLDGAGNPISAPFTVPHRTDETSDWPCHHVVLRGG